MLGYRSQTFFKRFSRIDATAYQSWEQESIKCVYVETSILAVLSFFCNYTTYMPTDTFFPIPVGLLFSVPQLQEFHCPVNDN